MDLGPNSISLLGPPVVVDRHSLDVDGGHTIDWPNVPEDFRQKPGQTVTVGAGGAAGGAVTVPVEALKRAITAGTTLSFGGAKFARVNAPAAAGAVSVSVDALPTALVAGDKAVIPGEGPKSIPAWTAMGAGAAANGGNGPLYPRVAGTNPATCLLATAAVENSRNDARSGYGVALGGVFYENNMPDATGSPRALPAAIKNELAAAGTGFAWRRWQDTTV